MKRSSDRSRVLSSCRRSAGIGTMCVWEGCLRLRDRRILAKPPTRAGCRASSGRLPPPLWIRATLYAVVRQHSSAAVRSLRIPLCWASHAPSDVILTCRSIACQGYAASFLPNKLDLSRRPVPLRAPPRAELCRVCIDVDQDSPRPLSCPGQPM